MGRISIWGYTRDCITRGCYWTMTIYPFPCLAKTPTDIYDKLFGEAANYQPEVKPTEMEGHRRINVMFDIDIRTILGLVSYYILHLTLLVVYLNLLNSQCFPWFFWEVFYYHHKKGDCKNCYLGISYQILYSEIHWKFTVS